MFYLFWKSVLIVSENQCASAPGLASGLLFTLIRRIHAPAERKEEKIRQRSKTRFAFSLLSAQRHVKYYHVMRAAESI